MKIRFANVQDIDGIIAVDSVATADATRAQHIGEWVAGGGTFIALIDQEIVGYAVLEYTFFTYGFITMLIVQEDIRRQGIATALVNQLEKNCRTEKLFTSTNESNTPMQAFLANISYERSGVVYNLDDGDPELFYFKKLVDTNV